ncbi:MAG: hypothetical protein KGI75_13265 [Rhizobiaceae bacterium]|nr:hypothetical protein [Rhizobiaceae bacterium]
MESKVAARSGKKPTDACDTAATGTGRAQGMRPAHGLESPVEIPNASSALFTKFGADVAHPFLQGELLAFMGAFNLIIR